MCAMTHWNVQHNSGRVFYKGTWLVCMCAINHSYLCHDSLYVCHESFICVPWFIETCSTIAGGSSARHHDSFARVPWIVYMCAMTHWHDQRNSGRVYYKAPWLICTCAMNRLYVSWLINTGSTIAEESCARQHWSRHFATITIGCHMRCVCVCACVCRMCVCFWKWQLAVTWSLVCASIFSYSRWYASQNRSGNIGKYRKIDRTIAAHIFHSTERDSNSIIHFDTHRRYRVAKTHRIPYLNR